MLALAIQFSKTSHPPGTTDQPPSQARYRPTAKYMRGPEHHDRHPGNASRLTGKPVSLKAAQCVQPLIAQFAAAVSREPLTRYAPQRDDQVSSAGTRISEEQNNQKFTKSSTPISTYG